VLGGEASVLRGTASGRPIVDPEALICCSDFGGANRCSDPTIGSSINQLARLGCAVTLRNPVGLYIHHLDLAGFTTPDGTPVDSSYFTVVRGDASQGLIERAVFEVPAGESHTVSDVTIAGEPIRWGGQIAERITMNLVALAGPPGGFANTPMTCVSHCCAGDGNPDYLFIRAIGNCGPGQHPVFDWSGSGATTAPPRAFRSRGGHDRPG
jgi:hypothetical protein